MENRQLNLLEDLENFEAIGKRDLPNALLNQLNLEQTPDLVSKKSDYQTWTESANAHFETGGEKLSDLSLKYCAAPINEATDGNIEGPHLKPLTGKNDDALTWIKRTGDTSFLTDLNFLKDLKEKKLPNQDKVKVWYYMRVTQIAVAVFIILNFLMSAIKAQRQPSTKTELYAFEILEIVFALIFAFELAVNMYGNWCRPFFVSGWNWFDLIIVLISLFTLGLGSGIPGINTLRLFRAFRVIRLFKRIPSLKRIVEGVIQSIPGVGNAFIVLTLIMAIWSILGVEFYSGASPENFGTFSKGMFSMFQCMTLDSWSGIARPLIKNGPMHWFFFCSYVLIAGIIMVNVVVAVLLEKFIGATGQKWIQGKNLETETETAEELANDDMMMDRLLFLEMEFVKVHDKLDALVKNLLDDEMQMTLKRTLTQERSKSFLRTRTGKLAMRRASVLHRQLSHFDSAESLISLADNYPGIKNQKRHSGLQTGHKKSTTIQERRRSWKSWFTRGVDEDY